MRVVAQQRKSAFYLGLVWAFIPIAMAIFMPWLDKPVPWVDIALRAWFVFGGMVFFWALTKGWHPDGHGLVFTEEGLQWQTGAKLSFRSWMMTWKWDEIVSARLVKVDDLDGDPYQAIILQLKPTAPHVHGPKYSRYLARELQRRYGEPLSENVAFLEPNDWQWNPEEVAQAINESVSEPLNRAKWSGCAA